MLQSMAAETPAGEAAEMTTNPSGTLSAQNELYHLIADVLLLLA